MEHQKEETLPQELFGLFKDKVFQQFVFGKYKLYDESYRQPGQSAKYDNHKDVPIKFYRGAVRGVCDNNGHLGVLDNPAYVSTIQGYNVFQRIDYRPIEMKK